MLYHKCLNHKRTRNPQHLKSSLFVDGNHGLLSSVLTMATRAIICGGTKFTVSSRKSIRRKIFDAIRSSLHGKAGSIVVRLGTEASITDILKKMDSVFGEVDTETDLLAALYSARQGPAESVSDWGCRLETLFDAAKRQTTIPGNPDEVLRSVFWAGLRQELKDVSAYHFDTIRTFDELRTALRRIEMQHMKPSTEKMKSAACKSAQEQDKEKSKEKTNWTRLDMKDWKP